MLVHAVLAAALLPGTMPQTGTSGASGTETPHLTVAASSKPQVPADGRISLLLDVAPKKTMHVYAPDKTQKYIPVSLSIQAQEGVQVHAPAFPAPEKYFFKPLKETQLVYSKPFRIVQDVTAAAALRKQAAANGGTLALKGTLRYQACDDTVCYMPRNVPVTWTVRVQ